VNERGTWTILYTAAPGGIAEGGGIVLHISPFWGWSVPQNSNPDYPGYATVHSSNRGIELDVLTSDLHYVLVRVKGGELAAGETISITYGDTGDGRRPGGRAKGDRYAEGGERFLVKVDGDGDGFFVPVARSPVINIVADEPVGLTVTAPSLVEKGVPFRVVVAAVDRFDNWAKSYGGKVKIMGPEDGAAPIEVYQLSAADKGSKTFSITLSDEGLHRLKVVDEGYGFEALSNTIACRKEPLTYRLYWGDLHGHSGLSDGSGTPDDYFSYGRDVAGLDICALTDHDAHGLMPLDESPETWALLQKKSSEYYESGTFVTFLGYEWTNWTYGHKHVLFLDDDGPLFSFRRSASAKPEGLWRSLKGREAITISHHVAGGPIATDWNYHDPEMEMLVEVCSVHGNSESSGCPKQIYSAEAGHFVQDALAMGYRLGIVASGDTHNGHPGRKDPFSITGGLVGVYARSLTREGVWEALKKRRVYGTSGPRIVLDFVVNGYRMGEEVKIGAPREPRTISIRVVGMEDLSLVELVKNRGVLKSWDGQGREGDFRFIDDSPAEDGEYYYVRVMQKDGGMAWSSPVWVVRGG
jgi:hypothetical protein